MGKRSRCELLCFWTPREGHIGDFLHKQLDGRINGWRANILIVILNLESPWDLADGTLCGLFSDFYARLHVYWNVGQVHSRLPTSSRLRPVSLTINLKFAEFMSKFRFVVLSLHLGNVISRRGTLKDFYLRQSRSCSLEQYCTGNVWFCGKEFYRGKSRNDRVDIMSPRNGKMIGIRGSQGLDNPDREVSLHRRCLPYNSHRTCRSWCNETS